MNRKHVLYAVTAFLGISAVFGMCYYISFKNALLHFNREATEQNTELLQQLLEYSGKSEQLLYKIIEDGSKTDAEGLAVAHVEETVRADAVYIAEVKYLPEGITKREQLPLPGFMAGISREELCAYVDGYMEYLPVNEYLDGLMLYEVVSFSPAKVILRKTYDETKVENRFYIGNTGGYVTVYYSDLKTVYEYTEIELESLPFETREQVKKGFYVKDAKELYSILEGYTS